MMMGMQWKILPTHPCHIFLSLSLPPIFFKTPTHIAPAMCLCFFIWTPPSNFLFPSHHPYDIKIIELPLENTFFIMINCHSQQEEIKEKNCKCHEKRYANKPKDIKLWRKCFSQCTSMSIDQSLAHLHWRGHTIQCLLSSLFWFVMHGI